MAKGFLVVSRSHGIYQISKHHQRILSVLVQWLPNLNDFWQEFYLCYSFIMLFLKITSVNDHSQLEKVK